MDYAFSEIRVRTRLNSAALERLKGHFVQRDGIDIMLTGPTTVRLPTGEILATYLPGALQDMVAEDVRAILFDASKGSTDNRGMASGFTRKKNKEKATRTRTPHVRSTIIGSFDRQAPRMRCRLTAWSGREMDQWQALFPLFQSINGYFKEYVPDRYAVQEGFAQQTHPDWRIADTVFTTITVNRSYPTGVHTDAGDLEQGFSTLAVLRKGNYSGGIFTFPEYRIGVNMQHGDLLLMDAHQWHGNTPMTCMECGQGMGALDRFPDHTACGVERISVVAYYRTKMAECGSRDEEYQRGLDFTDKRVTLAERTLQEMEGETMGATV